MKLSQKLILLSVIPALLIVAVSLYASKQSKQSLQEAVSLTSAIRTQAILNKLSYALRTRLSIWKAYVHDTELQSALIQANEEFAALQDVDSVIDQRDALWRKDSQAGAAFIKTITDNNASQYLRKILKEFEKLHGYPVFPEVFVTNRFGVNIAQTNPTSDYRQNDEEWWQRAVADDHYLGNVDYDKSAKVFSIDICLRIDDAQGEFLGVLKAVLNLEDIVRLLKSDSQKTGEEIVLFDQQQRIIHRTNTATRPLAHGGSYFKDAVFLNEKTIHQSTRKNAENGKLVLATHVLSNSDEILGTLGWSVLIESDAGTVFQPAEQLSHRIYWLALAFTTLCIVFGAYIIVSILRRLKELRSGTEQLKRQEFSTRVPVHGSDELAELGESFNIMAEQLQSSSAELRDVRNALDHHSIVSITDVHGRITYVNNKFCEISGYSQEELIGQDHVIVNSGYHPKEFMKNLQKTIARGDIYQAEIKNRAKDGSFYWVETTIVPFCDRNGKPLQYVSIRTDITEQKKTQFELQKNEQLLQRQVQEFQLLHQISAIAAEASNFNEALQESIDIICKSIGWPVGHVYLPAENGGKELESAPIWFLSDQKIFQQFKEITEATRFGYGIGLPGRVWEAKQMYWIEDVHEDDNFPRVNKCPEIEVHGAFATPVILNGEVEAVLEFFSNQKEEKDTELLHLMHTLGLQLGRVLERRRAEEQLTDYATELERSNKDLDEFAYVASHDLKAPLRAIQRLAEWISEDAGDVLPEDSRNDLQLLQQRAVRMEHLMNDLLEYSRAGRVEQATVVIETDKMLEDVVLLSAPPRGFLVEVDKGLPIVTGPKPVLEKVFRNLIDNAVKHHDRKDGHIHIRGYELENNVIEFEVSDDGPGIPKEFHGQIFQMFKTLKPRDDVEGSGMGLAMIKKSIESLGGCVDVESEGERGTTFRIRIPKDCSNINRTSKRPLIDLQDFHES